MALMTKGTPLKQDELVIDKRLPCSVKFILQATLLFVCAIIIIYLYYGFTSATIIQSWSQFTRQVDTEDINLSESSKWQPLSGKLFCSINSKFGNEELDQLDGAYSFWMRNCDSAQIYTYSTLSKTRTLPYRSIYAQLKSIKLVEFWESIYSFVYSYKHISQQFSWYLNTHSSTIVFLKHLTSQLYQLDHRKPFVFISQAKNNQVGLTIMSNEAVRLLVNKLYGNDELCAFNEKSLEGLRQCFENIGVEVKDERHLKLYTLDYENSKWIDNLEHVTFTNLLSISGCDTHMLHLIRLLTEEKQKSPNTTSCLCNQTFNK